MTAHLWLLDPGHGGVVDGVYQTAGKRSPEWPDGRQLLEGVFNRQVVKRVLRLCDEHDIAAVNIVPELWDVELSTRIDRVNGFCGPNHRRGPGAERYIPMPSPMLISVHANGGGGTGLEIWTSPGETDSDKLATVMYEEAGDLPGLGRRHDYADGDPDKEKPLSMTTETKCPAVLLECAFMDTLVPDCELMLSRDGVWAFAWVIYETIARVERDGLIGGA